MLLASYLKESLAQLCTGQCITAMLSMYETYHITDTDHAQVIPLVHLQANMQRLIKD